MTVAVLLVRAGMGGDEAAPAAQTSIATTATAKTTTAKKPAKKPKPVYAEVEAGDTLDQIAAEHDTTVERILELNPGLDPTALQIGQRIRVG